MTQVKEDNIHVVHGPPFETDLPTHLLGIEIKRSLLNNSEDSIAMIDAYTGEKLLSRSLFRQSVFLAEALRRLNYRGESTVISISSENSLQFFVPVLAALFNGSIVAPVNHNYTSYEVKHTLDIGQPKVVFCSRAVAPKFIKLKNDGLDYIEKIIVIDSLSLFGLPPTNIPGVLHSMEDFIHIGTKGQNISLSTFEPANGNSRTTPAVILMSSGTTGLPKGVTLSHLNIMVRLAHSRDNQYHVNSFVKSNVLGVLPFFHGYGFMIGLSSIINGQTTVCMKRFDEDIYLKSIQDYKITDLPLAPPLALFLAKSPKTKKYDLSSVVDVYCGAAPLSRSIEDEIKNKINVPGLRQAYGLTEATLAVVINTFDNMRPGSCGQLIQGMSIKVRDPETGKSLGVNKVGEICIKGPLVMMGYYKNEKATKESFTSDGWLKTGDLGYYDQDRFFYIIDRLKELIKYKGFQVAPAELEGILINNPKIDDVAVVGLPDETVGERPVAFVVKKKGTDLTEAEVQKHVADLVSPQKRLSGGVIFIDAIPKNPSGKILRRELRKLLANYKVKLQSKL